MQVKGKNSSTASWTYSRLFVKTHLYLSTISGTRHLKTTLQSPRIHGHKGSRAPKAISFNDIENVVKFIKSMFCLRMVRCFFLWDLPFSPRLPIDSAQNEWHNLIVIIKRYLQTQFEFNPETFRIFENPLKIKKLLLYIIIKEKKWRFGYFHFHSTHIFQALLTSSVYAKIC